MIEKPSWTIRRRLIVATLGFCAGEIAYLTFKGLDTALNSTIANGCFLLAGSVIGGYIFGAAWDDRNFMAAIGKNRSRPRRDDPEDGPDDTNETTEAGK